MAEKTLADVVRILCNPAVKQRENCRPEQPSMGDTTVEISEGGRQLRR
jgi:hypothetical protein